MDVLMESNPVDIGGVSVTFTRISSLTHWHIKNEPSSALCESMGTDEALEHGRNIGRKCKKIFKHESSLAQQSKDLVPLITNELTNYPDAHKSYEDLRNNPEWGKFIRETIVPIIRDKVAASKATPVDLGTMEPAFMADLQNNMAWYAADNADRTSPDLQAVLCEGIMNALLTLTPRERIEEALAQTAKVVEKEIGKDAPKSIPKIYEYQLILMAIADGISGYVGRDEAEPYFRFNRDDVSKFCDSMPPALEKIVAKPEADQDLSELREALQQTAFGRRIEASIARRIDDYVPLIGADEEYRLYSAKDKRMFSRMLASFGSAFAIFAAGAGYVAGTTDYKAIADEKGRIVNAQKELEADTAETKKFVEALGFAPGHNTLTVLKNFREATLGDKPALNPELKETFDTIIEKLEHYTTQDTSLKSELRRHEKDNRTREGAPYAAALTLAAAAILAAFSLSASRKGHEMAQEAMAYVAKDLKKAVERNRQSVVDI